VMPVLLAILLGSLDFAYLYRDQLTLTDAASDGAKLGAIQNNIIIAGGTADYTIINTIRQATAVMRPEDIQRIVVFKANSSAFGSPMAQVPAACKTSTVSITGCNIYAPAIDAFAAVEAGNTGYFNCTTALPAKPCGWSPTSRKNGPTAFDIEYLGVYIKMKHTNLTGLIGSNNTIEVAKISRLEPGNFDP